MVGWVFGVFFLLFFSLPAIQFLHDCFIIAIQDEIRLQQGQGDTNTISASKAQKKDLKLELEHETETCSQQHLL